MSRLPRTIIVVTMAAACMLAIRSRNAMQAADNANSAGVKVSSYAPAADLANQLIAIAGRLDDLLAKPEDFDDARKSRIAKEANVAAVVALCFGALRRKASAKRFGGISVVSGPSDRRFRGLQQVERGAWPIEGRHRGQISSDKRHGKPKLGRSRRLDC